MTTSEWNRKLHKLGFVGVSLKYANIWPSLPFQPPGWAASAFSSSYAFAEDGTVKPTDEISVGLDAFAQTKDEAMSIVLREARKIHEERQEELGKRKEYGAFVSSELQEI